jgi:hypothetical protein
VRDTEQISAQVKLALGEYYRRHKMLNYLKYTAYRKDGIRGQFMFEGDDVPFCVALTHAFPSGVSGSTYVPIPLPGTYTCQRGTHHLHDPKNSGQTVPIETFEILGIEGHSGVLFHPGNYNADSDGCVLLGEAFTTYDAAGDEMITSSQVTFKAWMSRLAQVNTFTLVIA